MLTIFFRKMRNNCCFIIVFLKWKNVYPTDFFGVDFVKNQLKYQTFKGT